MSIKYKASQPSWRKLVLVFATFSIVLTTQAQIVSENDSSDDKKEKVKKEPKVKSQRDSLTGTTYYLTGLYNYGHRKFADNSPYGSYEDWKSQKADYSGGATFGLFLPINNWLTLDMGISYFGQKEKYDFDDPDTDSAYSFQNTYMQVGIPLKLRYTYGDKFQVFGFAGVTAVNILNIRFNENYTKYNGEQVTKETVLDKEKLAIFNVFGTAGVGVTYNFDWIGITFYPEYRHYFFETYDQSKPISHKMYGLGLNLGFTLRF